MDTKKGLSAKAYKTIPEGESYDPYVPSRESPLEFTVKSVVVGILCGVAFGAANAYLGLRAGLTISTSIPVAVLTVAAFRVLKGLGGSSNILEANFSQTVGSASSSLASGIIFTLPALFLWNLDPTLGQMTILALLGGLLGVLFMIPLRRFLIDREHGKLPYPEGTACAEVLVASEVGAGRARNVFLGLGVGALFKLLFGWLRIFPGDFHFSIPFLPKSQLGTDISPALFGVGYILGPRIATIMVGGGFLSWLVIIPAIAIWGADRSAPLYPETVLSISEMAPGTIWTRYVRYIGAGAVAMGGLITLFRSVPIMIASFRLGAREMKSRIRSVSGVARTDRDLPLWVVGVGASVLALAMAAVPHVFGPVDNFLMRLAGSALVVVFAFFFVTVSARIVGLVGVTSNPTSGMTIATLLATASVFLALGWTGDVGKAASITVGCIVAIAASIAGDTSQDLKTGYLLGATPYRQQLGEMVGVLTSAVFVCLAVIALDNSFGLGGTDLPAPQATLMKLVIEGVLESNLPWGLVLIGVGIALVCEMLRIPSLPFAVGVYLPVTTTFPVFLGGLLRWGLERRAGSQDEKGIVREKGVLFGSGLVGGEGLLGVGIAVAAIYLGGKPEGIGPEWAGAFGEWGSMILFAGLILYFFKLSRADQGETR